MISSVSKTILGADAHGCRDEIEPLDAVLPQFVVGVHVLDRPAELSSRAVGTYRTAKITTATMPVRHA
jgi:hypothetical protein